jgi:hypothetical protein
MHKKLTISYKHEGGRAGDEDGGRWTEIGSRSFSISLDPGVGYTIAVQISTYNNAWPIMKDEESIEFAMPADWHLEKHLIDSLPSGDHEDANLKEPWLEFLKTLSDFESFTSIWHWKSMGTYDSVSNTSFSLRNGQLKYTDEFTSEDPLRQPGITRTVGLSEGETRDWPEKFEAEFMRLIRGERYQLEHWVYEGEHGNLYDNFPTEEEIISKIQALSLQKSNDLYRDLLNGLRMQLKSGLEGARQQWHFADDFWSQIRLLAELEDEIT